MGGQGGGAPHGPGHGPSDAGMMSGYVDIPVTSLSAMKDDVELLEARTDLIFWSAGVGRGGSITLEQSSAGYLDFYDNAPKVLLKDQSPPEDASYECSVQ